jgi:hypothetical protein
LQELNYKAATKGFRSVASLVAPPSAAKLSETQKGVWSMCDYSLHGIRNRLAEEGEILVVHQFHTGSKGLTAPEYLKPTEKPKGLVAFVKSMFAAPPIECAVCIPDGAKLVIVGISPALQQTHGLCATESATFRQLSADARTHRDAVEFKSRLRIRLQDLEEGQSVEVVALSSREAGVREETPFLAMRSFVHER